MPTFRPSTILALILGALTVSAWGCKARNAGTGDSATLQSNGGTGSIGGFSEYGAAQNQPFDIRAAPNAVNGDEICGKLALPSDDLIGEAGRVAVFLPQGTAVRATSTSTPWGYVFLSPDIQRSGREEFRAEMLKFATDLEPLLEQWPDADIVGCAKLGPTRSFFFDGEVKGIPIVPIVSLRAKPSTQLKTAQGCQVLQEPGKFGNPTVIDSGYDCCPNGAWGVRTLNGGINSGCDNAVGSAGHSSPFYRGDASTGEPMFDEKLYCEYGQLSVDPYASIVSSLDDCFLKCKEKFKQKFYFGIQHGTCFNNHCLAVKAGQRRDQPRVPLGNGRALFKCSI